MGAWPMAMNSSLTSVGTFALDDRGPLEGEDESEPVNPGVGSPKPVESAIKRGRAVEAKRPSSDDRRLTRSGLARLAFRRALRALERGDISHARGTLEEALRLDAEFADAWLVTASLELGRGRLEAARHAYRAVLKIRKDDVHAANGLGLIEFRSGSVLYAERLFRQILERGDSSEVRNNLGATLLAQGRIAEAKAEFERVVAVEPSLVESSLNLAVCHERAQETREAADAYRRFIRGGGRLDDPRLQTLRPHIHALVSERAASEEAPSTPMQ